MDRPPEGKRGLCKEVVVVSDKPNKKLLLVIILIKR